ncbi:MAG: 1,4-alpha-glucan branching enzyme, partial [Chthoniobacterales bacterium]
MPDATMSSFEILGLPADELSEFLAARHNDPFRILGPHRVGDDLVIRAFRPDAKELRIVAGSGKATQEFPSDRLHGDGLFQAVLPGMDRDLDYRLQITAWDGSALVTEDPYRYGTFLGEVDLHLFAEGNHLQLYEKFGAHLRNVAGVAGVYFAVWAPNAQRVSVVGDWNAWDGRVNPMRKLLGSGVWELFVPGVKEGIHYKFELRTHSGALLLK